MSVYNINQFDCEDSEMRKRVRRCDSLWRLLHSAVGVEGLKLLLDSCQRVGEFPVVQHDDRLLDPRKQV